MSDHPHEHPHAHMQGHAHGHSHGVVDLSITTSERRLWAIKWSFVGLAGTGPLAAELRAGGLLTAGLAFALGALHRSHRDMP